MNFYALRPRPSDADGKRVKSVMGAETILFVGAHYEVKNGSEITKYYMAGSTRIAMRKYTIPQNMTVEYLLGDHLGSTSLTAGADGNKVLEIRYREAACPLRYTAGVPREGEVRATWTSSPSTTPAYKMPLYTYTGQAAYLDDPLTSGVTEGFGLMFYQSRWYDPALGRMTQADTLLPQSQGVQTWDRYAYVTNSPVRYNDPSGHVRVEDRGSKKGCSDSLYCMNEPEESNLCETNHPNNPTCTDATLDETEYEQLQTQLHKKVMNDIVIIAAAATIVALAGLAIVFAAPVALIAIGLGASIFTTAATVTTIATAVVVVATAVGAGAAIDATAKGTEASILGTNGSSTGSTEIAAYMSANGGPRVEIKGQTDFWAPAGFFSTIYPFVKEHGR